MKFVTNFPLYDGCLRDYGSMKTVEQDCTELGLDGLEVIWDHNPYTEELPKNEQVVGYHMMFWSHWVDFWKGNRQALLAEYGDDEGIRDYYHGDKREDMIGLYQTDLQRAIDLEAEYVVFHVSEVSLEESFTYKFAHSDEETIDAAAECINMLLDGMDAHMAFLVENQWWPGLTFTRPEMTKRLLDRIEYDNKGVMLDVGHLLHTNTKLRTLQEAARYVTDCYEAHGELASAVRGLHLHQSLSGEYVENWGYRIPDDFTGTFLEKFSRCYGHILQIDRHQPWTDPCVQNIIERIQPQWVNNELSAWPRQAHNDAVRTQMTSLGLLS